LGHEHRPIVNTEGKWAKPAESTEGLTIEPKPEKPNGETGILTIRWGKDVLRQPFSLPASK
jgi:hypothetical protein